MRTLRRLRSIPTGVTPPPPPPTYGNALPRDARFTPPIPVIAVLGARPGADVPGLVHALVRTLHAHDGAAALLWTERTDTLDAGVVTTVANPMLFPDALQPAASAARVARFAHVGEGGERHAAASLFEDLAGATHAILDGRMLVAVRATLGVFVVGDGMGDDPPAVRALRDCCDVEVNEPGVAVAEALLRALNHRA